MPVVNKFSKMPRTEVIKDRSREWVYFIEASSDPVVIKIGKTLNLQHRLRILYGMSPVQLKLIGAVIGPAGSEFVFHECFAKANSHCEWFHPVTELLTTIKSLPKGGEISVVHLNRIAIKQGITEERVFKILRTATKRVTGDAKGICAYYERYPEMIGKRTIFNND